MNPMEIAFQPEILNVHGTAFCRKLQSQIQNAVSDRYNQAVDACNDRIKSNKDYFEGLHNTICQIKEVIRDPAIENPKEAIRKLLEK